VSANASEAGVGMLVMVEVVRIDARAVDVFPSVWEEKQAEGGEGGRGRRGIPVTSTCTCTAQQVGADRAGQGQEPGSGRRRKRDSRGVR
jgi:hypothetical protein